MALALSGAVGDQIVRDEWLGMMRVRVERQGQGRALLDKPDAGVTAAVNPPRMTLLPPAPAIHSGSGLLGHVLPNPETSRGLAHLLA